MERQPYFVAELWSGSRTNSRGAKPNVLLSGPGVLYRVPRAYTDTAERSEQLFPDWAKSSTPDFGLSETSFREALSIYLFPSVRNHNNRTHRRGGRRRLDELQGGFRFLRASSAFLLEWEPR